MGVWSVYKPEVHLRPHTALREQRSSGSGGGLCMNRGSRPRCCAAQPRSRPVTAGRPFVSNASLWSSNFHSHCGVCHMLWMLGLFSIASIQFYGKQFLLGVFPAPCSSPPPGLLWRMLYVCRFSPQAILLIWSIICYDPGTESVVCTLRFVEFCLSDCRSALMNSLWKPGSMPNFTLSVGHSMCYIETSGSLHCSFFLHLFWLSFQLFLSWSLGKHVIDWMAKENKPPLAGDSWWLWFVNVHRIYPFYTSLFSAIPWDWTWSLLWTADDWAIPCSIQWTDLFTGVVWSFTCKEITLC